MFRDVLARSFVGFEKLEFGVPKCLILDKFNLLVVKLANAGLNIGLKISGIMLYVDLHSDSGIWISDEQPCLPLQVASLVTFLLLTTSRIRNLPSFLNKIDGVWVMIFQLLGFYEPGLLHLPWIMTCHACSGVLWLAFCIWESGGDNP